MTKREIEYYFGVSDHSEGEIGYYIYICSTIFSDLFLAHRLLNSKIWECLVRVVRSSLIAVKYNQVALCAKNFTNI